ncbi:hypothetical protein GCM10009819_20060 [Agromyces tropicus]|uniref:PKD domain-containing protein n=1 Tax=Agromyces tropicus TaxID=555371 RepID=A0ABN2UL91_9MICO
MGLSTATPSSTPTCTEELLAAGVCGVSGDVYDSEATLEGQYESVANPSGPNDRSDNEPAKSEISTDASTDPPAPPPPPDICTPENPEPCSFEGGEPDDPPTGEPTVTLRDIASFRPTAPAGAMEPEGWAVVGLPANFIGAASVETRSGTLLGRPAEVRFHPVGYRWTHSDGTVVATSDPGAPWGDLGLAEFSPTPTSHVFGTSGVHPVEPSVVYAAEYRFDGSAWRWIDGTLTIAAPGVTVLVGEFDTVLVTGDCTVAPRGPGC